MSKNNNSLYCRSSFRDDVTNRKLTVLCDHPAQLPHKETAEYYNYSTAVQEVIAVQQERTQELQTSAIAKHAC